MSNRTDKPANITIYGSGYVGLVTAACLAEAGNNIVCMDIDAAKITDLQQGNIPIYEPGLNDLVINNMRAARISFTTEMDAACEHGDFQCIAVGTPPDEDGAADLQHVLAVAASIGKHLQHDAIIINKSTVPVGSASLVHDTIVEHQTNAAINIQVVSNPEFLREGSAIYDFQNPDRVIIGAESTAAAAAVADLYRCFVSSEQQLLIMDTASAELSKYAANAMLATRISFINEVAAIADKVGADILEVERALKSDPRIGGSFLSAGIGYGGSCFPKDVKALLHQANKLQSAAPVLAAITERNQLQRKDYIAKILTYYNNDLAGRCFAVWGLAFKPNTDDMREAPSIDIIKALLAAGVRLQVYDPAAMQEAKKLLPQNTEQLCFCTDPTACIDNAEAILLLTEWDVFKDFDLQKLTKNPAIRVVFDGRNVYTNAVINSLGINYFGMGRDSVCQVNIEELVVT